MLAVAYITNSNEIQLLGLRRRESTFLNNAHVVLTAVKDAAGADVEAGLPRLMKYVAASSGDYVAGLSHNCGFVKGQRYVAYIDVDDSDSSTERLRPLGISVYSTDAEKMSNLLSPT